MEIKPGNVGTVRAVSAVRDSVLVPCGREAAPLPFFAQTTFKIDDLVEVAGFSSDMEWRTARVMDLWGRGLYHCVILDGPDAGRSVQRSELAGEIRRPPKTTQELAVELAEALVAYNQSGDDDETERRFDAALEAYEAHKRGQQK